ncbi:transcriptional regulator, TetR family [Niastella yeongjuensis]|nr:transcriptional regulator, TetR family [Niastella yeongjuensis]
MTAASQLFYKQGYSNTGINQIIDEAKIAKATLYKHFQSKEDLLIAYLEETGVTTMEGLNKASQKGKTPLDKILAIFDHLLELVGRTDFCGCNFLNIVYEMPDGEERIRLQIKKQKDDVRELFCSILGSSEEKEELANEIYTLFEGALIAHKIHKEIWPLVSAKNSIRKLI